MRVMDCLECKDLDRVLKVDDGQLHDSPVGSVLSGLH
jgi:hypothetical protein